MVLLHLQETEYKVKKRKREKNLLRIKMMAKRLFNIRSLRVFAVSFVCVVERHKNT